MNHLSRFFQLLSSFRRNTRGNVAMIFGLTIVPLVGFVGAAVDYTRANNARSAMQGALDSAALMLSKDAAVLTQAQLETKATQYFNAMFDHPEAKNPTVTAAYATNAQGVQTVDLNAAATVPTEFIRVLGYNAIPINTTTTAKWGATRLRVALALDTTGSMSSDGKMAALKPAAKGLIDQLQALNKTPGDVYVSIVPFSKDVNVGSTNYNASWLKWNDWDAANGTCSVSGGQNNTKTKCQNNGNVWTPKNHNTWNGCVKDRDQNYDTMNTVPTTGTQGTLFWPEQYGSCPASLMPLSNDFTALKAKIDALYPAGNTNQGIGFAWGWQTLSAGPFTYPAETVGYQYSKVIVLMSDGLNTENRWSTSTSSINARQAAACTNAKADGITVYAVQVNTTNDPLQTVMKNCASSSDKFWMISSADQLAQVFTQIGQQLSKLRIAN